MTNKRNAAFIVLILGLVGLINSVSSAKIYKADGLVARSQIGGSIINQVSANVYLNPIVGMSLGYDAGAVDVMGMLNFSSPESLTNLKLKGGWRVVADERRVDPIIGATLNHRFGDGLNVELSGLQEITSKITYTKLLLGADLSPLSLKGGLDIRYMNQTGQIFGGICWGVGLSV
jgi:hypothetical protein